MQFKTKVMFLGAEEYSSKKTGNVSYWLSILADKKVYKISCTKEQLDTLKTYDEGSQLDIEILIGKFNEDITLKAITV